MYSSMKCYYCEKEVKCLSLHINKSQKCQESEHDRFNEFDVEEETIDIKNSDHYRKINEWRIIYEKKFEKLLCLVEKTQNAYNINKKQGSL